MPVAATFLHLLDDAAASDGPDAGRDGLVGSRLVRDTDLPDVTAAEDGATLPLTLVVTGGAGQVAGPLGLCARRGLTVAGLHLTARDPGDPQGATRRLVAALDEVAADLDAVAPDGGEVAVRVGLPAERPGHGWLAAADEVAAVGHGLLLPTTGAGTAVDAAVVVAWLDAALSREVPFALAAAAHPAVRLGTGHGLLNLLLATRSSLDGAGEEDLVWLLEQTDGETLVDLLTETGDDAVARARRWLTSAAVTDAAPVTDDLRGLGLLA